MAAMIKAQIDSLKLRDSNLQTELALYSHEKFLEIMDEAIAEKKK